LQVKIPFNYTCLLTGLVRGYCLLVAMQQGLYIGPHGKDFFAGTTDVKQNVSDHSDETLLCFLWITTVVTFFNGLLELHAHADVSPIAITQCLI
jgi:hypothetical protein